jgi:putative endonuclease
MASSKSESSQKSTHDSDHFELGQRGEAYAAAFLEQHGYRIVGANFSLPVGRNLRGALVKAEIDLVAYDGPTLCFIEVKTRSSDWFAPPQVNIDLRKRRQIARAARSYRRLFGLEGAVYRFDAVTVVLPPAPIQKGIQIELLRNYWSETSLRKRKHYHEWYRD